MKDYRGDIDGLRAIAVVGVILCHLNFKFVSGGFLGVDIFFVISGYLITRILEKFNNFQDLILFYRRRVMRLLPCFILVVFTTVFIGMFLSLESIYLNTLKYAVFGHLFSVNWLLFYESSDYFDFNTNLKPLLHIWSLSIEEQFYFIAPIIIIFLKRYYKFILTLLFIFSLVHFLYFSNIDKYYFSTFSRIWQIVLGSALVYLNITFENKYDNVIKNILLIFIVLTFFYLSENNSIHGSLLICVLTALFISFKNTHCFINNKYFIYIGFLSYSLYLWHQPIIAYTRHLNGDELSYYVKINLIIIIFVISQLSYKYVEKYFRLK